MHNSLARRRFLQTSLATTVAFSLPRVAIAEQHANKRLRIGLIADVHKDLMPDADERLKTFVDTMNQQKADAVIQLGDFCTPKPQNKAFLDIFNQFQGPKYHIIGNHETDGGFTRAQVVEFWRMADRYYSFDLGGYHFIILDSNDRPAGYIGGYPSHLAADQVKWLQEDLLKTQLPSFVFSHQSLEIPTCISNQKEIRSILEAAKLASGERKVVACFNGHWHIDHHREINGIPYVHINSASYFWMGGKYKTERLAPELAKKFPWVSQTAPYTKPLFATLEIDPAAGVFRIHGMKSAWMGPSPAELHYESDHIATDWAKAEISAIEARMK